MFPFTYSTQVQNHTGDTDPRRPLLADTEEENMELHQDTSDVNIEVDNIEAPKQPHPKNINVRAAFIHVIGDIIQSLGVLIAAIIIKLKVSKFINNCTIFQNE